MIIFIYISRIASNEKFKPINIKITLIIIVIILIIQINKDTPILTTQTIEINKIIINQIEEVKSTSKFFNINKINTTMVIIVILLITIISVTNISRSFEGPLKKTYV